MEPLKTLETTRCLIIWILSESEISRKPTMTHFNWFSSIQLLNKTTQATTFSKHTNFDPVTHVLARSQLRLTQKTLLASVVCSSCGFRAYLKVSAWKSDKESVSVSKNSNFLRYSSHEKWKFARVTHMQQLSSIANLMLRSASRHVFTDFSFRCDEKNKSEWNFEFSGSSIAFGFMEAASK